MIEENQGLSGRYPASQGRSAALRVEPPAASQAEPAAANAPWADALLDYEQMRNDLYAKAECTCPNPLFIGSSCEPFMKNKIRLVGYDDDYFFDSVNAKPREASCRCGRRYRYQWFREGVAFAFLASGMSAGTAETRSGSGLQPASPVGEAETPKVAS